MFPSALPLPLLLGLLLGLGLLCSLSLAFSVPQPGSVRQSMQLSAGPGSLGQHLSSLSKALPALLGAAVIIGSDPSASLAANSGGRSGGSSFRPSRSTSTRLNSYRPSTSFGYSTPVVPVAPMIPSPFFAPFNPFFSPVVYLGGGSLSFLFNTLVLAALVSFLYSLVNRGGGISFPGLGEVSDATVLRVQLALDEDWARSDRTVMSMLAALSQQQDSPYDRTDLSSLLSEACLTLLRRQADWTAASVNGEKLRSSDSAESSFQRMAIQERAKFQKELSGSELSNNANAFAMGPRRTSAVVSMVIAIRGKSLALRPVSSAADVQKVLQTLAAEAQAEDGENVLGVELLWTPAIPGEVLNQRQLLLDYPELLPL
jgi:uncharacterized membrane protein